MADVTDLDTFVPVERLFERENDEHLVHDLADRAQPPSPPRPHLGAHVIKDGNPESVEALSEPQVEAGEVDQDRNGRLSRSRLGEEEAHGPLKCGQLADDFYQSNNGYLVEMYDEVRTGVLRTLAPQAKGSKRGQASSKLQKQLGEVQIARRLATANENRDFVRHVDSAWRPNIACSGFRLPERL